MRWMLVLASLAVLASIVPAEGGTLNTSWTAPQVCTDGSPIAQCPVTKYDLWSVTCSASSLPASPLAGPPTATAAATATSLSFPNTPPGTWCVTIAAETTGGVVGPQTNVASGVVAVPPPGAPAAQNMSATLKTTSTAVYLATQIPNGWGFTQVGTVPIGTLCMAGHGVEQYNIVPQGSITVTWSSAVQPLTIVALCQ